MTDVPISDALIDSAQFQIQSVDPATTDPGNVRLFRGVDGWAEKRDDGTVRSVSGLLYVTKTHLSAADILNLHVTPKVIVPSPGPTALIIPTFVGFRWNYLSVPWDISVPGQQLVVNNSAGTHLIPTTPDGRIYTPTDSESTYFAYPLDPGGTGSQVASDEGSTVRLSSYAGAIINGDGSLDVTVFWFVV